MLVLFKNDDVTQLEVGAHILYNAPEARRPEQNHITPLLLQESEHLLMLVIKKSISSNYASIIIPIDDNESLLPGSIVVNQGFGFQCRAASHLEDCKIAAIHCDVFRSLSDLMNECLLSILWFLSTSCANPGITDYACVVNRGIPLVEQ